MLRGAGPMPGTLHYRRGVEMFIVDVTAVADKLT